LHDNSGRLVIIGGAEDKQGECLILREVVRLAGGDAARLLVLTAATQQPEQVGNEYRAIFQRLGVREVGVLDISCRLQAEDRLLGRLVDDATGVFFTGGDQLRITSLIGGTYLFQRLHQAFQHGVVIAGTSAGASVMSSTMIVQGFGEQEPRPAAVRLAPGFALVPDAVIDQHFAQRGRLGRLLSAIAQNPFVLGFGIDEDTAMVVRGPEVSVIGSGTVVVLDGQHVTFSNTSEISPQDALALGNVKLHVLPTGYRFDLQARRPREPITGLSESTKEANES
jgi:cyanophycinase